MTMLWTGTGSAHIDLGNAEDGILNESAEKTLTIPFNDLDKLESTIEKEKNNEDDIALYYHRTCFS